MKKPIKVLQIVGNSSYGGASYLILEWCRYLLQQGCRVEVLATDPLFCEKLWAITDVKVIDNINIPREIRLIQDAWAFWQTIRLLRSERYDIVHTYTATPSFIGRLAARLVSVPVILHHQAGWTVTEFSSLKERVFYTPLEYIAVLLSTKSICVSRAVAQQAQQFRIAPQRKLTTICNGIDPHPFLAAVPDQDLRDRLNVSANHLLIGATGRLAAQKDNRTLLQALGILKSLIPGIPFTLLLAGDGPERNKLEKLVDELDLHQEVKFLGFYGEIPSFLATVDIFVSSSLWEGLSISIMEAMATAKPIIATSILPNAELIEDEVTGLLVPPISPEAVAEAVARFAKDPAFAKCCGLTAQQRVLQQYTIERMFTETWDLYIKLLSENKSHKVNNK